MISEQIKNTEEFIKINVSHSHSFISPFNILKYLMFNKYLGVKYI